MSSMGLPDLPPQLAAALQQQAGGGAGGGGEDAGTPLEMLQECISDIHSLLVALRDPADVDTVTAAMRLLTQVQRRMMAAQSGPSQGSGY